MRRRVVMALLGLGVIAGYGSGFAHLHCLRERHAQMQQQWMHEVAQTCVDAARTRGPIAQAVPNGAPGGVTVVVNPAR